MLKTIKRVLLRNTSVVYRMVMMPVRLSAALRHTCAGVNHAIKWAIYSREDTNFTYDLTLDNLNDLAQLLAVVTGCDQAICRAYIDEASQDDGLRRHIIQATVTSQFRAQTDLEPRFARRLGWYALVRLMKPRVVVETGVDKGLGSVLLCSALQRNEAEGFPGRYYGIDINFQAGWMLSGDYSKTGNILYGDSIASLESLNEMVDLFISDSDHSFEYEAREYSVITAKLSPKSIILSDNAHDSNALERYSRLHNRSYLYFQEKPNQHWYRGAGIGISFLSRSTSGGLP